MLFENIDIRWIDLTDELFYLDCVNDTPLDWDGTQPLFNPVWLQQKAASSFRIVDGFSVIRKLHTVSPDQSVPAMVFPESSSLIQLWEQRVRKRELEGNLSTAAYLIGLSRLMEKEQLTSYPVGNREADLPTSMKNRIFDRQSISQLIENFNHFSRFTDIHQLGFKQLDRLNTLSETELNLLGNLLDGMHLKGKKLTTLLDLVDELDRGFNIHISDLDRDTDLVKIRADIPPHQRYRHIKARLIALRFPQLSRLIADWDNALKRSELEGVADIRHDPYFEADSLEFLFTVSSTEELKQQLKAVLDRADTPELQKLFSLI